MVSSLPSSKLLQSKSGVFESVIYSTNPIYDPLDRISMSDEESAVPEAVLTSAKGTLDEAEFSLADNEETACHRIRLTPST